MDGDLDLDLLIGNDGQDRLYLNDGSGVFAAGGNLPVDSDSTRTIALGDVDGDQDLDALIGSLGLERLYLNDGTGVFVDASDTRAPRAPSPLGTWTGIRTSTC